MGVGYMLFLMFALCYVGVGLSRIISAIFNNKKGS